MRPVLFQLGGFEVKSYGVFVALAFLGAWVVLRRELGRRAGRADAAGPLLVAAAVGGLVGARVYWYIEHADTASAGDVFSAAGFTWYGGVVVGALAVLAVARRLRVRPPDLLAAAAPALALGYALGRIACQFAGDGTYGRPSDLPWAMSYPHGEVPTTERVHPTPVYETLAGLMIFRAAVASSRPARASPAVRAVPAAFRSRAIPRRVHPAQRPGHSRSDATAAVRCGARRRRLRAARLGDKARSLEHAAGRRLNATRGAYHGC